MNKNVWVGAHIDSAIIDKVKMRLDIDYNGLVSQATLYRILLGMFADGLVDIDMGDIRLYSPVSIRSRRPADEWSAVIGGGERS